MTVFKKKSLGEKLKSLFGLGPKNEDFFEKLEDMFIESDLGTITAMQIVEELRDGIKKNKLKTGQEFITEVKHILRASLKVQPLVPQAGKLNFYLVLGVNGVGKTTTIAKMAYYYSEQLKINDILLSAADTFRAAGSHQLVLHGERLGIRVINQATGADPGAVIYDTITSALAKNTNLVIADTAGRMHNKEHLIKELGKIDKIIQNRIDKDFYKKILVIDATTGQNAYAQAETFHKAIGLDAIVLSKYDSTAKGGIVIPICRELGIPFSFVGVGEQKESLIPFDIETYLDSLVAL
jgi:fused signal recognition particle receptor